LAGLHNDPLKSALSVAEFLRLEILELEQTLLYDRVGFCPEEARSAGFAREQKSGPEAFMSRLPRRLRILHVGLVAAWPELYRDLRGLARAASSRFPLLRIIRLDCYVPPPTDETKDLEVALRLANIELTLAAMPMSDFARGMLRDRPGHPVAVQEPSFLFSLPGSCQEFQNPVEGVKLE